MATPDAHNAQNPHNTPSPSVWSDCLQAWLPARTTPTWPTLMCTCRQKRTRTSQPQLILLGLRQQAAAQARTTLLQQWTQSQGGKTVV
jgi:hypothetical protein